MTVSVLVPPSAAGMYTYFPSFNEWIVSYSLPHSPLSSPALSVACSIWILLVQQLSLAVIYSQASLMLVYLCVMPRVCLPKVLCVMTAHPLVGWCSKAGQDRVSESCLDSPSTLIGAGPEKLLSGNQFHVWAGWKPSCPNPWMISKCMWAIEAAPAGSSDVPRTCASRCFNSLLASGKPSKWKWARLF